MWRDKLAQLDIPNLPQALQRLLSQIPAGRVSTYGDIADALGDRSAARWVGEELLDHPHDERCLCHRVVLKSGDIGRYITGDPDDKTCRLLEEAVRVDEGRVDLSVCLFTEFESDRPLCRLLDRQNEIADAVVLEPYAGRPAEVAGVDVSYRGGEAVAAYAVVDRESGLLVRSTTVCRPVLFPYIPGYLSYRELPLLIELLSDVADRESPAEVILVDGNGILHHRRAGIAAHLGAVTGLGTIGVGKNLLCGKVDLDGLSPGDAAPIVHDDDVVGAAIVNKSTSRPIYVSPGNRVDVDSAVRVARDVFFDHRLPEPLYWADRLSREVAQT